MSTRTVVVFGFLVFSISVSRSLHFESFSTVFIEVFFFPLGIDISISRQVLFSLSFTTMFGLFALISLFVWAGLSQSVVTALFSVTVDGLCL